VPFLTAYALLALGTLATAANDCAGTATAIIEANNNANFFFIIIFSSSKLDFGAWKIYDDQQRIFVREARANVTPRVGRLFNSKYLDLNSKFTFP